MRNKINLIFHLNLIIILIFFPIFISANDVQLNDGSNSNERILFENKFGTYQIINNVGSFKSKSGNFEMTIKKADLQKAYLIEMKGKTKGWIAVGFGRTEVMKDAEIMLGYIKDNVPFLTHQFGTSYYSHEPIDNLNKGSKDNSIKLIEAKEKDEWTYFKFFRFINANGEQLKSFKAGDVINFMYALSPKKDPEVKHKEKGYLQIKLP